MRSPGVLTILLVAGLLRAQDGQQGSRPGWPCVAGRAVDPAYLDLSESTGGQLFLFQKGEAAQATPVMAASYTHPATVLRVVGHLNGTRDLEFPVDSTIESLLVLASLQCRNQIQVFRPAGSEMTDRNSALSVDLAAGKILRVDRPEAGKWRVRLAGTGLFVLSVHAKSEIALAAVEFTEEQEPLSRRALNFRVSGPVARLGVQLVDASGGRLSDPQAPESTADRGYRTTVASPAERYRILVTGEDAAAWPFQRMWPVLFRANQPAR